MIDEIDFTQLTALTELRFGLTRSPRVIDLTHNLELTFLNLSGLQNTEILDLPHHNKVNVLLIDGCKALTTGSINAIIDDVHFSAVTDSRYEGIFTLREEWFEETDVILGPPSAASIDKLRDLRDNYLWFIAPELE